MSPRARSRETSGSDPRELAWDLYRDGCRDAPYVLAPTLRSHVRSEVRRTSRREPNRPNLLPVSTTDDTGSDRIALHSRSNGLRRRCASIARS